jgi:hypothetical protein
MDTVNLTLVGVIGAIVLILVLSILSEVIFRKATRSLSNRQVSMYSVGVPFVIASVVKPADLLLFVIAAIAVFGLRELVFPHKSRKK